MGRQIAMLGRCTDCGNRTADYVLTDEMYYMLCDTCFAVEVLQIATSLR